MTNRKIPLLSGEYFHIYNRGNSKQEIFLDGQDRDRFIKLLYISNSKKRISFRDDIVDKKIDAWEFERGDTLVSIGAWVLMPNHFHIYITSPKSDLGENKSNISEFMRKLMTAYTKYFNTKYERTGALYEGRFRSTHVKGDNQAKYLFSYIHLNPIKLIDSKWKENGISDKDKALQYLNTYNWSSYDDHRGIFRKENKILQLTDFPNYFLNIKDFDSEIFSWLQYEESPLSLT
ncbi:MAG: transposase [Candidatus Paceibacterota bacterium]|jgi:putative transposase